MRKTFRLSPARALGSVLATASLTVLVAADASAQSLEDMQKQLEALQRQVQSLEQQMEAAKAEREESEKGSDVKVTWKGAPEIASADGAYKMKLRGRLFADFATGDQDEAMTRQRDLSATEFRAARIGVEGVVAHDFKYVLEVDFAGEEVSMADGYIAYQGLPVDVKVGQFKTPNSLEEQTSSRYISFMERGSITDAFGLARQIGVGLETEGEMWTLAGGIFKGSAGSDDAREGLTLAARATVAPRFGDKGLLHLGASVRHRENGDGQDFFRYRQRPHQHLASRLIDTSSFADSDLLLGAEAAMVYGPFSLQGEYMTLNADAVGPTIGDVDFDGFYLSGSWFITGESRKYSGGNFGRVNVARPVFDGGMGAWQVAARFDTIDLSDGAIEGGSQDSYIFGVNWHLNNYVRLMANYNITEVKGGANDGADIDLLGLRAQVDW